MKNKKKTLIIIAVCIAAFAGIFAISKIQKNTDSKENEPCENCTVNTVQSNNPFNIVYSGETKTYNAYDFIIEKMSQAQYWTYDEYEPEYWAQANSGAETNFEVVTVKEHVNVNGTGWVLSDENTASFARGFEGKMEIHFVNNTAECNTRYATIDSIVRHNDPSIHFGTHTRKYDLSDFDITQDWTSWYAEEDIDDAEIFAHDFGYVLYDCNQRVYKTLKYDEITETYTDEFDVKEPFGPNYYILGGAKNDLYWEVENTLKFYNDVFKEAGCPLLNMPEGTLASYKNKTIEVPVELIELRYTDRWGDGLIHCPWRDQEDFELDITKRDDIVWLENYEDILNQEFPAETEMFSIDMCDSEGNHIEDLKYPYYSPVFLQMETIEWLKEYGPDENSSIVANYYAPLYKHIFGFNGIYFINTDKYAYPDPYHLLKRDNFSTNKIEGKLNGDIIPIYKTGDVASDTEIEQRWDLLNYFNNLLKYYDKENIFGVDYPVLYDIYANSDGDILDRHAFLGLR